MVFVIGLFFVGLDKNMLNRYLIIYCIKLLNINVNIPK